MKCGYIENFLVNNKRGEYFECDEKAIKNKKYCIFHDKNFAKNANDLQKKLIKKQFERNIETQAKTGEIKCVGYRLPEIKLNDILKDIPIYFTKAIFYGKVDFSKAVFEKDISFSHAKFEKGLDFKNAVFKDNVNFSRATSKQKSNFQACEFIKYANFTVEKFFNVDFRDTLYCIKKKISEKIQTLS